MLMEYPSGDPTCAPSTMPYDKPSSKLSAQPSSDPDVLKLGIQEAQVSLQKYLIRFILHIISSSSSSQRDTRTRRRGSLRISHSGVHKAYCDTNTLFSRNILQIYDKDKRKQVKVIMSE